MLALSLPAFAEIPVPDWEKRKVGDLNDSAVIPVAANNAGRFGAHFKTRVVIFNPTDRAYSINAILFDGTGRASEKEISMGVNVYRVWDNFLVDDGFVVWEVNGESDSHYFYAVEVDNESNDGTLNWSVPVP